MAAVHPETVAIETQVLSSPYPSHLKREGACDEDLSVLNASEGWLEVAKQEGGVAVADSTNESSPVAMLHSKLMAMESGTFSDGSYLTSHEDNHERAAVSTTSASPLSIYRSDDSAVVTLEQSHESCDPRGQSCDPRAKMTHAQRIRNRPLWRNSDSIETDV